MEYYDEDTWGFFVDIEKPYTIKIMLIMLIMLILMA